MLAASLETDRLVARNFAKYIVTPFGCTPATLGLLPTPMDSVAGWQQSSVISMQYAEGNVEDYEASADPSIKAYLDSDMGPTQSTTPSGHVSRAPAQRSTKENVEEAHGK
eukprot:12811793-Heterocapsa_arctica.AAC.1